MSFRYILLCLFIGPLCLTANAQSGLIANDGWAANSVNTVIFRKNSLVTATGYQYVAYYDSAQFVVLGRRKTGSIAWQIKRTLFKGDATDAHKSISIMVDGNGYLHVVWGQHNNPLNYAKSTAPYTLNLSGRLSMVGNKESKLSYPEFYKLANGNLLFLYRDGGSGNGDLIINLYNTTTQKWERLQNNLIDGEGQRNAYWQTAIDQRGTIHISWVWRETPDVASNHDLAYACSKDGGITWQTSTGEKYKLPITAASAEYACKIPQQSELINQTSMFADVQGHPFIATYWREAGQTVPQYHLVYKTGDKWQVNNLGFRKTAFSLSGGGTKRIPISRPQIVAWANGKSTAAALIFRDEERGSKVSVAISSDVAGSNWTVSDLDSRSVGSWEPTYDTELWKNKHVLDLFIQNNTQVDGEGRANIPSQPVEIIEWKPLKK
ncbi:BNR repeat-containing protein [Mucilaginibacter agri]|uniref:Neuraminidase n=1 Tax=Mucilaginibacter agri TaxID=2695265 RepID=A0A966DSD2_9SPHI|nr:BNR repeat-containing protein [Mucilaginibacter agri]NCD68122.1 neuraminidase [Mucilaginibacter agri]